MMDLSTIPLPAKKTGITVTSHPAAFPKIPTWVSGIVYAGEGRFTVQCSVCLRCATTSNLYASVVIAGWNFTPDDGETGHTHHRRCRDCQAAHRHPAEQLDMLAYLEEMTS